MKEYKNIPIVAIVVATLICLAVMLTLMFSSCANEKKFVRFHDKKPDKAINYCLVWNPAKDSVHETVVFKPGKPKIIQGETIYADCDSAYKAAYDEAAKLGLKVIKVKKVAVTCPPSINIHDTVAIDKYVQVRYTKIEDSLKSGWNKANAETAKFKSRSSKYLYVLIALLSLNIVYIAAKIYKKSILA